MRGVHPQVPRHRRLASGRRPRSLHQPFSFLRGTEPPRPNHTKCYRCSSYLPRAFSSSARACANRCAAPSSSERYNQPVMSIQVAYRDGVFKPLEEIVGAEPGAIYTAFSKEELRDFIETVGWLKAAEKSFEFWDNPADAVYDTL